MTCRRSPALSPGCSPGQIDLTQASAHLTYGDNRILGSNHNSIGHNKDSRERPRPLRPPPTIVLCFPLACVNHRGWNPREDVATLLMAPGGEAQLPCGVGHGLCLLHGAQVCSSGLLKAAGWLPAGHLALGVPGPLLSLQELWLHLSMPLPTDAW